MRQEQEAKAYLRKRLGAEHQMSANLEEALVIYARKICELAVKYNISVGKLLTSNTPMLKKELDRLMQEFIDELYDDVVELSEDADKDRKAFILAFINTRIFTMTLHTRIEKWAKEYFSWVMQSYDNGMFGKDGMTMPKEGIPTRIGAMYGLDRLLRHTIARAWMESRRQNARDNGALYFSAHRGSSYDCGACDDNAARGIQPMLNFNLPLHNNCCCYAIFYDAAKRPISV